MSLNHRSATVLLCFAIAVQLCSCPVKSFVLSQTLDSSHPWQPTSQKMVSRRGNLRRSARIRALRGSSDKSTNEKATARKRKASSATSKRKLIAKTKKAVKAKSSRTAAKRGTCKTPLNDGMQCLARDIETQVKGNAESAVQVIGIDEAGRGPLAGPVVAAAVIPPKNLEGVVDSKKITKEEDREALFESLVSMPDIRWAVSVIDAQRIDEINILQATLEGMQMAATALVCPSSVELPLVSEASIDREGSYVVISDDMMCSQEELELAADGYFALIDGNKIPKQMPCEAESVVKGDSKEFCIAAASILAKVTRDRLMHGYDKLYSQYNLKQHKGYPTAQHMKAVMKYGASPIHRRTFAPLKHMNFDKNGRILNKEKQ